MKKMKFIILSLLGTLYVDNAIACSKSGDWTKIASTKNHPTVYSCKNGSVLCYNTTDKGPPYVTLNFKVGDCKGRKPQQTMSGISQGICAGYYQSVKQIWNCNLKSTTSLSRIVPHKIGWVPCFDFDVFSYQRSQVQILPSRFNDEYNYQIKADDF